MSKYNAVNHDSFERTQEEKQVKNLYTNLEIKLSKNNQIHDIC